MNLAGKTAIVTGAAGILGAAVAAECEAQGARTVLIDVAAGFADGSGARLELDLTDAAAVAEAIAGVGEFDIVCNIAGGFDMGPKVFEITDAHWSALFDINVTTLRHMLSATLPKLVARGRGSIINVGALGAMQGLASMGAYTAAKSVVMRLTEAASEEVRRLGVNVNAVLPSLIDTPRNRADMPNADHSTWVTSESLAKVICFLASDAAADIHGALIPVRGQV